VTTIACKFNIFGYYWLYTEWIGAGFRFRGHIRSKRNKNQVFYQF